MIVEKSVKIDDGRHEGVITAIQYRDKPYAYTDVVIDMQGVTLNASYPTKMMEESKLGLLMKRFDVVVAIGLDVKPEVLIGRPCEFMTMQRAGKKHPAQLFANVLPDSVKPLAPHVVELTPIAAAPGQQPLPSTTATG